MISITIFFVLLAPSLMAVAALTLAVLTLRKRYMVLGRRVESSSSELERLQHAFARFAPAELVERIVSDGMLAVGQRLEATVMFADICSFTRLSEKLDPSVVIEMLNGYYRAMAAVIQANHGHVTRLMGDGIMSAFGVLERNPWHVQDAVEAARGMRGALRRYNQELRSRDLPELSFGIGIHCGTVVAGLVGSEELSEFTVMGDVVNVASRVEALTRRFHTDILITDEVKNRLGDRFGVTRMPPAPIKGKSRPIVTWTVDETPTGDRVEKPVAASAASR
jgi:class 3 adenylate cyclase